jgi:hypothetical protein
MSVKNNSILCSNRTWTWFQLVILYSGPKAQHHCSLLYGSLALALILPSKIIQNKIKQDCNNYVLSLNVQIKHFFFSDLDLDSRKNHN